MTTSLDTKLIPAVQDLLKKFGKTVTFTTSVVKSYNPATGSVSNLVAERTHRITPPTKFDISLIDNTTIEYEDLQTYTDPISTITFEVGLIVTIDSRRYQVVSVSPIYSGDDICLFELQLRK